MASLKERIQQVADRSPRRGVDILAEERPRLTYTRLEDIERDPSQPRKDLGDLTALQASIAAHGLLQPLVVSPLETGRFLLIAGERRFTAACALQMTAVPTLVRTVEDHQRLELQLIENLHRKDLNPLEEAQSYRRLMDEFGLTQDQVARRIGKSKSAINQSVRLLDLPAEVQAGVRASEQISKSVLLEIVKQPSPEAQTALWEQARRGELTVKKARQQKPATRAKSRAAGRATKSPTSMAFRYPIQTERALVTITFEQPKADQEEVVAALEEALSVERARLR